MAEECTVLEHVREQVEECSHDDSGRWVTCSGCHESEDGYDVGYYPYSKDFRCKLGGGCSECGGIGATWDTTDYEDYAKFMLENDRRQDAVLRVEAEARQALLGWDQHPPNEAHTYDQVKAIVTCLRGILKANSEERGW